MAFGASWLPLSKTQLQGVRKLADQYSERGVVVYWVSTESEDSKSKNYASDDQLRGFAQKYGLKVTVLRDPDGVVSKRMGVDQLPSIIILDKQGNIVGGPIGGLDPNGNLTTQVASFNDQAQANDRVARLHQAKVDARIVQAEVGGKTWYRVQIGGFKSREEASKYANQLKAQGAVQDFIITTIVK